MILDPWNGPFAEGNGSARSPESCKNRDWPLQTEHRAVQDRHHFAGCMRRRGGGIRPEQNEKSEVAKQDALSAAHKKRSFTNEVFENKVEVLCETQVICAFMFDNFSFALCVVAVSGSGSDRSPTEVSGRRTGRPGQGPSAKARRW